MTARPFHVTLVLVAMLWLFANSASAMLHPQQGRFMQRDLLGYVDGMGAYGYQRARPVCMLDALGLSATQPVEGKFTEVDLGHRDPELHRGRDGVLYQRNGATVPEYGQIVIIPKPVKPSEYLGKHRIEGSGYYMTVSYWWSSDASKVHERRHVSIHKAMFNERYNYYKKRAGEKHCFSCAMCWRDAIDKQALWTIYEGAAQNAEFDVQEYNLGGVDTVAAERRPEADRLKAEFKEMENKCEIMHRAE